MPKRAILFASYSRKGIVDSYVVSLLRGVRDYADTIIFVSASGGGLDLSCVSPYCDMAISRENVGYDFKSWHVGLELLQRPEEYDQIVLMNDSVFGPLYGLGSVFEWLNRSGLDCASLSSSNELGYHLQLSLIHI